MYRMIRRRRRTSDTDYKRRVELLKGGMPRLVVRKSNRAIKLQVVEYSGESDHIIASANSSELRAMGWEPKSNIPTAYLTGLLISKKYGAKPAVLDSGLYKPIKGAVIFAAAKGAQDGGMKLIANIEFDENRLSGAHIASYAKENPKAYSAYAKAKFDVREIKSKFESTKKMILTK